MGGGERGKLNMVEDKPTGPEKISPKEQEDYEPSPYVASWLTGVFTLLSIAGIILENTTQKEWLMLYLQNNLDPVRLSLLENVLNHLGDITEGFLPFSIAILGELFLSSFDIEEKNKWLQTIRNMAPFILSIILFIFITDAETTQQLSTFVNQNFIPQLPVGTPDLKDLFGGCFGILSGNLLFDYCRQKLRQSYRITRPDLFKKRKKH